MGLRKKWLNRAPGSAIAIFGVIALGMIVGASLLPTSHPLSGIAQAYADSGSSIKALKRAAQQGDVDRAKALIRELGDSGDADAAEPILLSLMTLPPSDVLDDVLNALQRLGVENVGETCERLLKKKKIDPIVQAAILELARKVPGERTEGWLLDSLDARYDLVIRNAIAALVNLRSKNAIPRLIDKLENLGKKRTLIYYEVDDALVELTGHRFDSIADWRSWWEIKAATFDPNDLEDDEAATGVERRKPGKRRPEFFGVEILSQRIMFVIDCSGSMVLYDPASEEGGGGGGADYRVRQRIYRVKSQLKAVIEKLPKRARFNIVSYSNTLNKFNPKGIVAANGKWKKKAYGFADSLQANGYTHTDEALKEAFKDRAIDTIILLSDGAPTREGSRANLIPEILEWVRKNNRLRKITIHTFGFDGPGVTPPNSRQTPNPNPEPLIDFLQTLARETGGKYTSIK